MLASRKFHRFHPQNFNFESHLGVIWSLVVTGDHIQFQSPEWLWATPKSTIALPCLPPSTTRMPILKVQWSFWEDLPSILYQHVDAILKISYYSQGFRSTSQLNLSRFLPSSRIISASPTPTLLLLPEENNGGAWMHSYQHWSVDRMPLMPTWSNGKSRGIHPQKLTHVPWKRTISKEK